MPRRPHRFRLAFFTCIAALVLAACQASPPAATIPIAQPDNDARAMRYITLANGLRALLISDPDTDKAAAALDVQVGSRFDPEDREGLAHFLEHMLFLGTDKYPEAGEYQRFITAHGGTHNAYTAFEHTNYFFDVDSEHLAGALDRFARFFVAPLFTADYVEREKRAVHSEYLAKIRDDQRRSLEAMKAVLNPAHPFHGFSVGNLETLADRPDDAVRDDLIAFYEQHYSADQMTLVVIGKEPLDQLERLVRPRFAPVADRDAQVAVIEKPLFAQGGVRLDVRSINQQRTLTYSWPMPDVAAEYRTKPLAYLANILGHEGAGSLLSYLKAQGWASGLSAGEGFGYRGGTLFSVSIDLTEAGQAHIADITAALYQAVAMLRRDGIQSWLYEEQSRVAEQRFRFRQQPKPIWEASRLAANLHDYEPADVLQGDYLMDAFVPERILELTALLTPQRMVMTLLAPDVETDQVSQRYETPYRMRELPSSQLAAWSAVAPGSAVRLPAPNPFIAGSLTVEPLDQAMVEPVLLEAEEALQLWYLQEPVFRVPRGNVLVEVALPPANDDAMQAVLTEMWVRMAQESLTEYAYPAYLAGLNYSIAKDGAAVEVRLQGFDDRQAVLLERVLRGLRAPDLDAAVFERVRADYQRSLHDRYNAPPYQILMDDLATTVHRQRWPSPVLAELAGRATLDAVQRFGAELWRGRAARMLVHGNFTAAEAKALGKVVHRELLAGAPAVTREPVEVLLLPGDHAYRRPLRIPHRDAALLWYRQAAERDKTSRAALGVSAQMINADFYTRLRTEQQLGYVVLSAAYPVREVPGLVFLVQSPVAGPGKLAAAYDEFLARWRQRPAGELRPLFERHREALARRLAEAPENLDEATDRYWHDLTTGYLDFDSREQLLSAVAALEFEQWLALFHRDVLNESGRGLWLSTDGRHTDSPLQRGRPVGNLRAFKDAQHFVAFPAALPSS